MGEGGINSEGREKKQLIIKGTELFKKIVNEKKYEVLQFLEKIIQSPFDGSIDDYLKSSRQEKQKKGMERRTVVRVPEEVQGLFSGFPPLAVKAMGSFLPGEGEEEKPENLIRQFETMSRLFQDWKQLPDDCQRLIRPIELYGVVVDEKNNQFLFMERVSGVIVNGKEQKGMIGIYKGKTPAGNPIKGFSIEHHPLLYKLIKEGREVGEPITGVTVTKEGKTLTICPLSSLEDYLRLNGVNLTNLDGKDILWFDDEEGNRQYRIIDMRTHNYRPSN